MFKTLLTAVALTGIVGLGVGYNATHKNTVHASVSSVGQHDSPESAQMLKQVAAQQEGLKHCERPDPNNPDVGKTDPNKIGCGCVRKCVNGQIQENTEEGKRCKNHCHPDTCECPDPCKT